MSIDELLLINGATLEIDSRENYFLKLRYFPDEAALKSVTWIRIDGYRSDTFFHPIKEYLRLGNVFHRKRDRFNEQGELISSELVEQTDSEDLSMFSHCYKERVISALPSEMETILSYSFCRSEAIDMRDGSVVKLYLDEVFQPLDYSIVTLGIHLNFDPAADGALEFLRGKLRTLKSYSYRPVYTKFMLVLQCTSSYDLYETLYALCDPARDSVPNAITSALEDTTSLMKNRDYLWFLRNQIQHSQVVYDMGFDEKTCFARLKELRPKGSEIITPYEVDL